MKLFKITILQLLFVLLGFYGSAQNLNINGSCVTATGLLTLGGDVSNTTYNGKPVHFNGALNLNVGGSPTTTDTYLYFALASELGTSEDRWVVSYSGQPYYYFISNSATAPLGEYLPFDTLATTTNCGGSVFISLTCVVPPAPTGLACYQTATFNNTTCVWDVTGTQAPAPTGLACWQTATFNTTNCVWDVTGMQAPAPTGLACYQTATFNNTTCVWDVTGTQPLPPISNINVTATGNCDNLNGVYVNVGLLNGYYSFQFVSGVTWNISFDGVKWVLWINSINITGYMSSAPSNGLYPPTTGWIPTQCLGGTFTPTPSSLLLPCYQSYVFNGTTCQYDITGTQPPAPTGLACYQTATFNNTTCVWDVTGTQAPAPTGLACYQTATFNNTTCVWDVTGTQPLPPSGTTNILSEGFESALVGWSVVNTSIPVGSATWGITASTFIPQSGTSHVFCNFNSVAGDNTISNWLIAPVTTLENGDVIKFWTRTSTNVNWPDRLQVRLSTTGVGTDPIGPTDEGSYTTLLADINPTLTTTGYPTDWAEYTLTVSGLSVPTSSRVAFRYFVTNGGPSGANSDIIGLDTFSITRASSALACYESYVFNGTTCQYDVTGTQAPAPTGLACYQTATFNGTTCVWDVTGTQDPAPTGLACYQTATFNNTTCVWDITGTQAPAPTGLACYQTATFNNTTCVWDVTGTQPVAPTLACYETATFNPVTCGYDVTGTPNTLGSVTITAVGSYLWPLPYGTGLTYTTSQIGLTNVNPPTAPCNTATLNLTILSTVPTVNTFTVGASCGATISGLNVTINTPVVSGATSYTFRLTNLNTMAPPQLIIRPTNSFALSNFPGITLGTAYSIQVSVNAGPFGPPCTVNTPAPASTIGANCGTTVASMSTYVYCTAQASVTGYRFRITNLTTSAVAIVDSGLNRFSFSQVPLPIRAFATTYSVEVALRNTDGTYLPYSIGCNVSTPAFPTTSIRPIQCGNYQATSTTESFVTPIVATATKYRFRLSSVVPASSATIDRLLNTFSLNMFPALPAGTACTVEVSLEIGGVFGPYGSACTIITPGLTKSAPVVSNEFVAIAFPNPFAEDFMFNVKTASESTIQIRVYDMLGKQIDNRNVEVSEIENLQIGDDYPTGVYNVIVSQEGNTQTLRVIKR